MRSRFHPFPTSTTASVGDACTPSRQTPWNPLTPREHGHDLQQLRLGHLPVALDVPRRAGLVHGNFVEEDHIPVFPAGGFAPQDPEAGIVEDVVERRCEH